MSDLMGIVSNDTRNCDLLMLPISLMYWAIIEQFILYFYNNHHIKFVELKLR